MTVKEHSDQHLGNFYSWMLGDFQSVQKVQENYPREKNLFPTQPKVALDSVRQDENRILTCFLENTPDKVRVTDILQQKRRWAVVIENQCLR